MNLTDCPEHSLYSYPKQLVLEAMRLPGVHCAVSYSKLPRGRLTASDCAVHAVDFNVSQYRAVAAQLLAYTRQWLSTRALAEYLLRAMRKPWANSVLVLLQHQNGLAHAQAAEYSVCTLLHGLREVLGSNAVEFPKFEVLPPVSSTPNAGTAKQCF